MCDLNVTIRAWEGNVGEVGDAFPCEVRELALNKVNRETQAS